MPAIFKFDLRRWYWLGKYRNYFDIRLGVIVTRYPPFSFEFAFFRNLDAAGYGLILAMAFVTMIRTLLRKKIQHDRIMINDCCALYENSTHLWLLFPFIVGRFFRVVKLTFPLRCQCQCAASCNLRTMGWNEWGVESGPHWIIGPLKQIQMECTPFCECRSLPIRSTARPVETENRESPMCHHSDMLRGNFALRESNIHRHDLSPVRRALFCVP